MKIIVHASPEATNDFAQSCLAIESMTRDIYTPDVGEVLNVSAAINFYQVKLTDALVSSLKFSKVGFIKYFFILYILYILYLLYILYIVYIVLRNIIPQLFFNAFFFISLIA